MEWLPTQHHLFFESSRDHSVVRQVRCVKSQFLCRLFSGSHGDERLPVFRFQVWRYIVSMVVRSRKAGTFQRFLGSK